VISDTAVACEKTNAMRSDQFNLSRRTLVASVACTAVVIRTMFDNAPRSPDAELVAFGRRLQHLTQTWDELAHQTNNTYDNVDILGLIEKLNPIESAIVRLPAKTIEGLLVKARAANWSREGRINPEKEISTDKKMAWSIVRDLLELSRGDETFST